MSGTLQLAKVIFRVHHSNIHVGNKDDPPMLISAGAGGATSSIMTTTLV